MCLRQLSAVHLEFSTNRQHVHEPFGGERQGGHSFRNPRSKKKVQIMASMLLHVLLKSTQAAVAYSFLYAGDVVLLNTERGRCVYSSQSYGVTAVDVCRMWWFERNQPSVGRLSSQSHHLALSDHNRVDVKIRCDSLVGLGIST